MIEIKGIIENKQTIEATKNMSEEGKQIIERFTQFAFYFTILSYKNWKETFDFKEKGALTWTFDTFSDVVNHNLLSDGLKRPVIFMTEKDLNILESTPKGIKNTLKRYNPKEEFVVVMFCLKPRVSMTYVLSKYVYFYLLVNHSKLVEQYPPHVRKGEYFIRCPFCPMITVKRCSRCKLITYCCKEHQRLDWSNHRPLCNVFANYKNKLKKLTPNRLLMGFAQENENTE